MKILALDSSGLVASAAYLVDGVMVAEYTVNDKLTHSQTLLPMLDVMRKQVGFELTELDAVAAALVWAHGAGLFYRASDRGSHSKRARPGSGQAGYSGPVRGRPGFSAVRSAGNHLSHHGCKKESGLYRILPF